MQRSWVGYYLFYARLKEVASVKEVKNHLNLFACKNKNL